MLELGGDLTEDVDRLCLERLEVARLGKQRLQTGQTFGRDRALGCQQRGPPLHLEGRIVQRAQRRYVRQVGYRLRRGDGQRTQPARLQVGTTLGRFRKPKFTRPLMRSGIKRALALVRHGRDVDAGLDRRRSPR